MNAWERKQVELHERKMIELHAAHTYQLLRLSSEIAGVPFTTVASWFSGAYQSLVERELSSNSAPEKEERSAKKKARSASVISLSNFRSDREP